MRYDDPRGSPRGHRPEGIPAVAMETQTLEQIEEESIGGDSEVEVLEPLESHRCTVMLLWEYRENANNTKGLKVFQRFLTVMPNF